MSFLRPQSRAGVLWRAFLAAFVIVSCGAATTAVAGLLQFHQLAQDISVAGGGVRIKQLTLPRPGRPETLLLIGSDHRADSPSFRDANTDTMLLMRLNASSKTINVLSIPRDLQVTVPGYAAPQKLNAAYSEGGYGLLLRTLKSQVFPDLTVNHIIDTNFTGFSDIVDAIGCVDSDVDHRYYNDTALTGYSSIDIQPGYQRLCGDNQSVSGALPFVRFRHTDSDIVRNARQQDFLRWAKDGYSQGQLVGDRDKLLRILGRHSTFDRGLRSEDGLLELFYLVVTADGSQIKQIPFPYAYDNTAAGDYVTSNSVGEQRAYQAFMTPTRSPVPAPPRPRPAAGHGKRAPAPPVAPGLVVDLPDGHTQAAALPNPGMPVFYAREIKAGSAYCSSLTGNCDQPDEPAAEYAHSYPREYLIPTRGAADKVPAYRMTLVINSLEGLFYGIQGVRWRTPPLLASPSATKVVHGRKLLLYAEGGKLTTVAWHLGPNTYWVSNTLTSAIPNAQLVAIAASMVRWR